MPATRTSKAAAEQLVAAASGALAEARFVITHQPGYKRMPYKAYKASSERFGPYTKLRGTPPPDCGFCARSTHEACASYYEVRPLTYVMYYEVQSLTYTMNYVVQPFYLRALYLNESPFLLAR